MVAAESSATRHGDSLIAEKNRIGTGPIPEWVVACAIPVETTGTLSAPVDHLLADQQFHAEERQTYFHAAVRLNTMQGVQSQSPWRLELKPRQRVTLHWIKTLRGGAPPVPADLSALRAAEGAGAGTTLSLMLEDLRPGDVLEWCYTINEHPLLLPNHCSAIFKLPENAPIGRFHFSVRFSSSRPMRWKSSVAEWTPAETPQDNGDIIWDWSGDNQPGLPPEDNAPGWHINYTWIQISDCLGWGKIAVAFTEAWQAAPLAATISDPKEDALAQAKDAIRMVQDEYRHLPSTGELDGSPPAPPELVMRRRFGDNKDLSFLLAHLLKELGLPARLVLVNTNIRQSLTEFLPATTAFNHVVVEYAAGGETRWVDAARGAPQDSSLGAGLPLDGSSSDLIPAPESPASADVYELKESILLDTTGGWSWLGVVVAARGPQAAALRQELAREGLEGMAAKRLAACAHRFTNARRHGALEYRDDPATNEFFLAEIFEIKGFLALDPKTKWYKFEMPNDYVGNFLNVPDAEARRAPFALPHPCTIVHTIELHSVALPPAAVQQRSVESDHLRFTRLRKTLAGNWTMQLTLATRAGAVPPAALGEHRRTVQKIRAQSAWSILVPAGDGRPRKRGDFARLPAALQPVAAPVSVRRDVPRQEPLLDSVPSPQAAAALETQSPSPAKLTVPAPKTPAPKQRKRGRKRSKRGGKQMIVAGCAFGLFLILIVFLVAKNADRWHIFKSRPAPPSPASTLPVQ